MAFSCYRLGARTAHRCKQKECSIDCPSRWCSVQLATGEMFAAARRSQIEWFCMSRHSQTTGISRLSISSHVSSVRLPRTKTGSIDSIALFFLGRCAVHSSFGSCRRSSHKHFVYIVHSAYFSERTHS